MVGKPCPICNEYTTPIILYEDGFTQIVYCHDCYKFVFGTFDRELLNMLDRGDSKIHILLRLLTCTT